MSKLTPPRAGIPIGRVTVDGKEYETEIHPEWLRYLTNGLFERAGGTSGPTTVEASQEAGGNGGTEEARAMIVELRGDVDQLVNHGRIAATEEKLNTVLDMDVFALLGMVAELRERVTALAERINSFDQAPSL